MVIGVVVAVFTALVGIMVRKNLRELLEIDGRLFGVVVQLINGVGKLRVAGAGDRAYTHWVKKYAVRVKLWFEAYRLQDRVRLFNQIVPALSLALLFLFAHELVVQGPSGSRGISLGVFLAFSAAYGTFLAGVILSQRHGGEATGCFRQGSSREADPRGATRDRSDQGRPGSAHRPAQRSPVSISAIATTGR